MGYLSLEEIAERPPDTAVAAARVVGGGTPLGDNFFLILFAYHGAPPIVNDSFKAFLRNRREAASQLPAFLKFTRLSVERSHHVSDECWHRLVAETGSRGTKATLDVERRHRRRRNDRCERPGVWHGTLAGKPLPLPFL